MLINIPKGQAARLGGQKGCEEETGMGEDERACLLRSIGGQMERTQKKEERERG